MTHKAEDRVNSVGSFKFNFGKILCTATKYRKTTLRKVT